MDEALGSLLLLLGHLSDQFRELREGIQRAIAIADKDPEMALTRSRKVLEYVVRDVFERRINEPPGTRPLENLLQRLTKEGFFPARLEAYANVIRALGNVGAHRYGEQVTQADVVRSLTQLLPILEWYFESERPGAANVPREELPSPGPLPDLRSPLGSTQAEGDGPEPSDEFSATIRQHMAALNRQVERLTAEQFQVIRQLRGVRRVRVAGCAGSGKTLVAAEKAIRLCNAGLRTLFLCHSPLLAEHVRRLTLGSGVEVETFGEWVAGLAGESAKSCDAPWTNYEEPDSSRLARAFDAVAGRGPYEAVVVDEGQDFRDEWWTLVEAALMDPVCGTLYIFHDDLQALLPYRARYPVADPVLDLSRNCRNAGKVYELMRHIHRLAPPPEEDLKDLGEVLLLVYERGAGSRAIGQAVRWLCRMGLMGSLVALHAGMPLSEQSALAGAFPVQDSPDWQAEVRRKFLHAIQIADPNMLAAPAGGKAEVAARLAGLSASPSPSAADVELVREVAWAFRVSSAARREVLDDPRSRAPMSWAVRDGRLKLWKPGRASLWASEIIMHLERDDWHRGIPEPATLRFEGHLEARGPGVVPVYRVAGFKGLEADAVLFHLEGSVPISREELYVGITRARMLLALVVDQQSTNSLPLALRALQVKTSQMRT